MATEGRLLKRYGRRQAISRFPNLVNSAHGPHDKRSTRLHTVRRRPPAKGRPVRSDYLQLRVSTSHSPGHGDHESRALVPELSCCQFDDHYVSLPIPLVFSDMVSLLASLRNLSHAPGMHHKSNVHSSQQNAAYSSQLVDMPQAAQKSPSHTPRAHSSS